MLPPDASKSYSDWETLAVVAEHGGHLEHLGLHLNGFAKNPPCAGMTSMPKLKQLSVGTSKIPCTMKDVLGPARFLSHFPHPSVSDTVLLQVPRPYGVGYPIRITRVFYSGEDG